jgi:hypothetical protein
MLKDLVEAKAKLSEYRKAFADQAENRLRHDDPQAYRVSQRDSLDPEVLARLRTRIDKATGGALTQSAETAAAGGLVGLGSTTLPMSVAQAPLPASPPRAQAVTAVAPASAAVTTAGTANGTTFPASPPRLSATDQFRADQNAGIRAAKAKLARYAAIYGADQAEERLRADDPVSWSLSKQSEI